jgi:hypothetical protein
LAAHCVEQNQPRKNAALTWVEQHQPQKNAALTWMELAQFSLDYSRVVNSHVVNSQGNSDVTSLDC